MKAPITFSFVFTVLVATTLVFNYRVDPYQLYSGEWSREEPQIDLFWHLRLHKPYQIERLSPDALILGSSVSGRLEPSLVYPVGQAGYNASLPGVTMFEARRMLEHAAANNAVSSVVLSLEYYMFQEGGETVQPGYADHRLLSPGPGLQQQIAWRWQRLLDGWTTLLSGAALRDSLAKLKGENRSSRRLSEDGSWRVELSAKPRPGLFKLMAVQKYREYAPVDPVTAYADFETLLATAEKAGVRIVLVLSPYHAYILSTLEQAGHLEAFIAWQRRVSGLAAKYRVPLYSFQLNPELVLQSLGARAPGYLDGVHYRSNTARHIGQCLGLLLQGAQCAGPIRPQLLSTDTLASYSEAVRRQPARYRQMWPEEYAQLSRLLLEKGLPGNTDRRQ